ncbi:unnamed protein product [Allacma fusca]|uniref:Homeotic protein spalt-major n=1 Tax=Allacma fusca TaxID=39272 RepID=A0A8J2J638_9HEXA|nr:unnamed protein product [Allacma fusca]
MMKKTDSNNSAIVFPTEEKGKGVKKREEKKGRFLLSSGRLPKEDKSERWRTRTEGSAPFHRPLSSPNDDEEMDDGTPARHRESIPHSNCLTDEEDDDMHTEDANNNESKTRDVSDEKDVETKELQKDSIATALHNLIGGNFPWPAGLVGPNVTLEAIQNTKVAMAQFAANALNNHATKNTKNNNNGSFQELAALQTTLFTLQQQQLLQLQLLQHLQQQLVSKSDQNSVQHDDSSPPNSPSPVPSTSTTPQPPDISSSSSKPNSLSPLKQTTKPNTNSNNSTTSSSMGTVNATNGSEGLNPHFASLLNCANQDPNQPLSPGLPPGASSTSILSPNGDLNIIREPNTLEVLQKRTQEVLDSASQGLLASSLVDDPNYRKKELGIEKGREPFFKHRCRYCGKVFSSDSALQIHIRSHTGERPFKCNVCGSRFTTKGNLKVHFQRHTARFPHVRMNPHPVPEHLDHLHPPIRPNSGHSTPNHSPTGSNAFRTPPPPQAFHPFNPLFHFSQPMKLIPLAVPVLKENIITGPEDLTKPKGKHTEADLKGTVGIKEEIKDLEYEDGDEDEILQGGKDEDKEFKKSNCLDLREEDDPKKEMNDCSMDSMTQENDHTDDSMMEEFSQDQPENLSSKSLPLMYPLPLMVRPGRPSSSSTMTFAHISSSPQFPPGSTPTKPPSVPQGIPVDIDPAKDPAIYTNLLPRPGSNDNAWESLIEVTKTSETAKLQQLVDNIDHKVTDPNQCIICQRVLSCKSALQMHYRTHTGERPFKCKICGRTFTTKGNLKTHMGVHRAKPPLRALLQCPVCHKRFTNSLVLQQHIRLHTGEPTDLTPEQIRAAEVKDFTFLPSNHFPSFPPHGSPSLFLSHSHSAMMKHPVPPNIPPVRSPDEISSSPNSFKNVDQSDQDLPQSFQSSLSALESQEKTVNSIGDTPAGILKASMSKGSPRDNSSSTSPEKEFPSNKQDSPLPLNSLPSPAAQQPQQQQPFITSTIIPHNNLQFLKVNYVFVK